MGTPGGANWFQSPLAADAALAEPLRRALAGKEALRGALRALLIRRRLTANDVAALTAAHIGVLDLCQALARLDLELPNGPAPARGQTGRLAPPDAARTGLFSGLMSPPPPPQPPRGSVRPAPDIAPVTMRVIVRAMNQAVGRYASLEALQDGEAFSQILGGCIARTLAEEVFPPLAQPDPNASHRELVAALLGSRSVDVGALAAMNALDRQLVARRLEDRQALMLAVAPPARKQAVAGVVLGACELLRRVPPATASEIESALAAF